MWGETQPRTSMVSKKHRWNELEDPDPWYPLFRNIKYCEADGLSILEPADDAATATLGGDWRMPSREEFKELLDQCEWILTKQGETNGFKVVSKKNGKSIFLPCAGWRDQIPGIPYEGKSGFFLSREISPVSDDYVNILQIKKETEGKALVRQHRYMAYSIRPVKLKPAASTTPSPQKAPEPKITITPPQMVDLGLSVKWGSFNLGASKPEEYGAYFAWGETDWKAEYSWETYKWCEYDGWTLTKYCSKPGYGFKEFTDMKTTLDLEDDAARARLGDKWRIPSEEEYQELLAKCSQEWTRVNGVLGVKFTSKINGNSIFLPAAGSMTERGGLTGAGTGGSYISSSALREGDTQKEYCLSLNGHSVLDGSALRRDGCSVRPVYGDPKPSVKGSGEPAVTTASSGMVDLGLSVKWATCNVGARSPEEFGHYYAWGETAPKTSYSWLDYKWSKQTSMTVFTKYCGNPGYGLDSYSDTKTRLDPEDDAARVNLGEGWRMPTEKEIKELEEKCIWEWTELNNVKGFKVTSLKNGNSIFLPAAGCMMQRGERDIRFCVYLWSQSMDADPSARPDRVPCLSKGNARDAILPTRSTGCTIRAVHE